MAEFTIEVPIRWSDLDAYGHVNHARTVTLLEEARIALLFGVAATEGLDGLARGMLVVSLDVRYRAQLRHGVGPVRVAVGVENLGAATLTLGYAMTAADSPPDARPAVTAHTRLASYDLAEQRPRRLTPAERDFLACYTATVAGRGAGG